MGLSDADLDGTARGAAAGSGNDAHGGSRDSGIDVRDGGRAARSSGNDADTRGRNGGRTARNDIQDDDRGARGGWGAEGAVRPDERGGDVDAGRSDGAARRFDRPVAEVDVGGGETVPVLVAASDQFAARLRKVARQRRRWATREGVTCYRVYDADLPDYAAAIDLYQGAPATPGRWLVIAEYEAPRTIDPDLAWARMQDILTIAPRVLEVAPEHVFARTRSRSRGGSQYARADGGGGVREGDEVRSNDVAGGNGATDGGGARANGSRAAAIDIRTARLPLIQEGGLTFAVSFDTYLDTGIFLDHRVTRDLVRERARNARWFLNLFAYTGTATCYAADAGVEETVTVDISNTYLDWAERNMAQNGFSGPEHHFVRADVMEWMGDMRRAGNTWDLIFCDPPTFSNSSRMDRSFDVQRDHVELLRGVADLLTPDGLAIFSCNLRTFKLDERALARAGVELTDITARTIPEDFARNPKIHRCYEVRAR